MHFENFYQELANGAEIFQALLLGVTQAEASAKPDPEILVDPRSRVPPL